MLKRKRILSLKMKILPPLCCQRSHKIWCHPLDSVRLSLTLLLFFNKLLKCSSSTNILQYFLVFFLSVYYLYFEIFINAIIISANCNAFSIIKQDGYILRKIDKWYISIFRTFYVNEKENCCPRMFPKLFFIKHFKFQSITSSFSNDLFNYLVVYRRARTCEHILLRHLAGFIWIQPQIKFLTEEYFHYILLNHIYNTYFIYLSTFVICYGLK